MTRRYTLTSFSPGNQIFVVAVCLTVIGALIERMPLQTALVRTIDALVIVLICFLIMLAMRRLCLIIRAITRSLFGR